MPCKDSALCGSRAGDDSCLPCLMGGFGTLQMSHQCCSALCGGGPGWFHSHNACRAQECEGSMHLPEGHTDIHIRLLLHIHTCYMHCFNICMTSAASSRQAGRPLCITASTAYVLSCWDNHLMTSSTDFLPLSSAISCPLPSSNSGAWPKRMVGYFLM